MKPAILRAAYPSIEFSNFSLVRDGSSYVFSGNDDAIVFEINCFTEEEVVLNDVDYARNKYYGFLVCNLGHQNNYVRVKIGRERLGFIFNVNSLTSDSEIDDKWTRIYAHAATDLLLNDLASAKIVVAQNDLLTNTEINDLIIGDDVSVVVLGKEQVDNNRITLDEIRLFLHLYGYQWVDSKVSEISKATSPRVDSIIAIPHISEDIGTDVNRLCLSLELAHLQLDYFSKYLTVYQIIEILINQLFPSLLKKISEATDLIGNPRALAQKISDSTKEEVRINRLYYDYIKRPIDNSIFITCTDLCNKFLDKTSPLYRLDPSGKFILDAAGNKIIELHNYDWPKAIYKVRNLVVHSQSTLIAEHHDEFIPVYEAFKLCCLHLLANFNISHNAITPVAVTAPVNAASVVIKTTIESDNNAGVSASDVFNVVLQYLKGIFGFGIRP